MSETKTKRRTTRQIVSACLKSVAANDLNDPRRLPVNIAAGTFRTDRDVLAQSTARFLVMFAKFVEEGRVTTDGETFQIVQRPRKPPLREKQYNFLVAVRDSATGTMLIEKDGPLAFKLAQRGLIEMNTMTSPWQARIADAGRAAIGA